MNQGKQRGCHASLCERLQSCGRGSCAQNVMSRGPRQHAQAARQPSFTAVVWGHGKTIKGFIGPVTSSIVTFIFLHERTGVRMQTEGTMPSVITQH